MNPIKPDNIMIMYGTGHMTIYPHFFLKGQSFVSKFRVLAKMSIESDKVYHTDTIKQWMVAIQEEINQCIQEIKYCEESRITDIKSCVSTAKIKKWDASKHQNRIKNINKSYERKIANINSKIRKLRGLFDTVEEVKKKYKLKSKRLF